MRPSCLLLSGLFLAAALAVVGSFRLGARISPGPTGRPPDDLDWLRQEFHLGEPELARIRELHEGYLPVCHGFCGRIAAAKAEMLQALGPGTNVSPVVEQKLAEIGHLRALCQAAMLRHFAEVSRLMPEAQGTRYLTEMQRLTLGGHEQIEQSMTAPAEGPHEHHQH